jgi:hypothetical protein
MLARELHRQKTSTKPNTNMKTKDQIELTPSVTSRRNLTTIPAGSGGRSESVIEEESDAIRPFQMANVPEAELTELHRRIKATRWPEKETVADATQGVQLATVQALMPPASPETMSSTTSRSTG